MIDVFGRAVDHAVIVFEVIRTLWMVRGWRWNLFPSGVRRLHDGWIEHHVGVCIIHAVEVGTAHRRNGGVETAGQMSAEQDRHRVNQLEHT